MCASNETCALRCNLIAGHAGVIFLFRAAFSA